MLELDELQHLHKSRTAVESIEVAKGKVNNLRDKAKRLEAELLEWSTSMSTPNLS